MFIVAYLLAMGSSSRSGLGKVCMYVWMYGYIYIYIYVVCMHLICASGALTCTTDVGTVSEELEDKTVSARKAARVFAEAWNGATRTGTIACLPQVSGLRMRLLSRSGLLEFLFARGVGFVRGPGGKLREPERYWRGSEGREQ